MKLVVAALASLVTPALAQVAAEGAWSRATAPRQDVGAAYVTLNSPSADRLIAASSPVAAQVRVHGMTMDGTVMKMREAPGIPLAAGQMVRLAPGGLHIMLMGLKAPLKPGDEVPLRLTFEHAPPLDIVAIVQPATATGPAR